MKKKVGFIMAVMLVLSIALTGCTPGEEKDAKVRDLGFSILSEEVIPEELLSIIETRNTEAFTLTYTDAEYLYICIGYGPMDSNGYTIIVDELYLGERAIHVDTELLGPSKDKRDNEVSYPYIVIKTEKLDNPVIYK